jgi:tetratricopeptide (TPR) repeat protein
MTAPTLTMAEGPAPTPGRTIELVLAHLHLKLGSLALARVELETLAGLAGLDTQGLVDLAEVRWRTGDLLGAGEAAAAALRTDESDPIALIVAAEAASAIGRPSEARRLATRAAAAAPDSIDEIFAGMPRSAVWAADANEPLPSAPTLFDRGPESAAPTEPLAAPAETPAPGQATKIAAGPMTLGFWDADEIEDDAAGDQPDPAREFEAGRLALVAGSFDEAALRFGLALRLAPALAPAVLEATEGARASVLSVVRGDAYRLAGHEIEARQAYAVAARGGLPERRAKVRARPKPRPQTLAPEPDEPDEPDDGEPENPSAESDEPGAPEPALEPESWSPGTAAEPEGSQPDPTD